MGSAVFMTIAKGGDAREAFISAVREAQYNYGHAGYTGTIAEKDSFTVIPLAEGVTPDDYVDQLIGKMDERVNDKWGPAGCFELGEGKYLFFGWASS